MTPVTCHPSWFSPTLTLTVTRADAGGRGVGRLGPSHPEPGPADNAAGGPLAGGGQESEHASLQNSEGGTVVRTTHPKRSPAHGDQAVGRRGCPTDGIVRLVS